MQRGLILVVLMACACTGSTAPTKEQAAEFYGLADARELTYDVEQMGMANETWRHIFRKNESFADELGFSREERNNSNLIVGTMIFAARLEEMVLMRDGDCLPTCIDYATPPTILKKPMAENTTWSTETVTQVHNNSTTTQGRERHEVVVGALKDVFTPAGTFKAYDMTWRTIYPDEPTRASVDRQLFFAEGKGFIQLKEGTRTFKVKTGVSP